MFFSSDEDVLVGPLTQLQREFPSVQLGSYPEMSPVNSHRVRIALESTDREMIEEVRERERERKWREGDGLSAEGEGEG